MLSLSQTTGYAIQALSCLSPDRPSLVREVAVKTGIGKPYLAKIFNLLAGTDLIVSKRGYHGGIQLARSASEIKLLEIVDAVEGDSWMKRCLLGMRECDPGNMCPCHDIWAEMKLEIRSFLERISLADVGKLSAKQDWSVASAKRASAKKLLNISVAPSFANDPPLGRDTSVKRLSA